MAVAEGWSFLQQALDYAARGWPVFPLAPRSKFPLIPKTAGGNGLHDATTDPATVTGWWSEHPHANVGLRTGVVFDVLDVDGDVGKASMGSACDEHGKLPETLRARTGSGGVHVMFTPTGSGNRAGILPKVDWRGAGGYIVAPDSIHPDGGSYAWLNGPDGDLATAPEWMRAIVAPPRVERSADPVRFLPLSSGEGTPYGLQAMDAELEELGRAIEGTRNHALNAAAFSLYQLVAGGELRESVVTDRLRVVGMSIGLPEREVSAVVASARAAGMQQARQAPDLKLVRGMKGPQTVAEARAKALAETEPVRPMKRIAIDLRNPPPPAPTLLRHLYQGRLTVLQSEPGVGKSWVAAWSSLEVIELGLAVIYIDEEGGPDVITERLHALGADPDVVDRLFHYYAFEGRAWGEEDLLALDIVIAEAAASSDEGLGMAVLDSLPDFLEAANMDEDKARDITRFIRGVIGRFRDAGAASLLLDHLVKPPTSGSQKKSRYGRGSGAKLAKADATLLLETATEFDTANSGQLRLWKTKDRRGKLSVPVLSKPALLLDIKVAQGSVRISEAAGGEAEMAEWDGPTACMEKVVEVLDTVGAGAELSTNQLISSVRAVSSYRTQTVTDAVARLMMTGEVSGRRGPRNAVFYRLADSGGGGS